ncbi:ecdysone receptor isoform X2 [Ixodes scapularis]
MGPRRAVPTSPHVPTPYEVQSKVLTKEYLDEIDRLYKQSYLRSIRDNSELLLYDWTTIGEFELVVDDIERINFEALMDDPYGPMLKDWKKREDDWSQYRYDLTANKHTVMCTCLVPYFDAPELLVSGEDQETYHLLLKKCAIKRESKKHQKDKDRPNSTTRESPATSMGPSPGPPPPSGMGGGMPLGNSNSSSSNNLSGGGSSVVQLMEPEDKKPLVLSPGVKPLSSSQEDLINKLVYYQQEFESPSEEDMKKTTPFPLGDSEEDNQRRFQHITEITILTVQLIVEFSKRVPGFDTLAREDQITLLKACSSEVMMLRGARKYDVKTDSIVFANNQPYTRDNYRSASVGDSADALFRFCRKMCQLRVDNAEYALLTAIVIFSERPCLVDPHKVERIQEYYIDTLRMYSENHRPPGKNYFARLLSILTELRTLGNMNAEMCFSLKVQNKKLPPFLAEIWDIQE